MFFEVILNLQFNHNILKTEIKFMNDEYLLQNFISNKNLDYC